MPAETGKIAHIAGALKKIIIFAQKFQSPNSFFNYKYIIAVCLDFLPVKSSFEPNAKTALL